MICKSRQSRSSDCLRVAVYLLRRPAHKAAVADLTRDNRMLKDVLSKKWCRPPRGARRPATYNRPIRCRSGERAGPRPGQLQPALPLAPPRGGRVRPALARVGGRAPALRLPAAVGAAAARGMGGQAQARLSALRGRGLEVAQPPAALTRAGRAHPARGAAAGRRAVLDGLHARHPGRR